MANKIKGEAVTKDAPGPEEFEDVDFGADGASKQSVADSEPVNGSISETKAAGIVDSAVESGVAAVNGLHITIDEAQAPETHGEKATGPSEKTEDKNETASAENDAKVENGSKHDSPKSAVESETEPVPVPVTEPVPANELETEPKEAAQHEQAVQAPAVPAVPAVSEKEIKSQCIVPTTVATISALKKLFEDANLKSIKLSSHEKEQIKEINGFLNEQKIPMILLSELLRETTTSNSKNHLQFKVILIDAISKIYIFETANAGIDKMKYKYKDYRRYSDLCIDNLSIVFKSETDDSIELQIIKTIVNVILNTHVKVHTAKLLDSIRLIYNIFILTVNENIQLIAEASLTQIIDHYFHKIESTEDLSKNGFNSPSLQNLTTFKNMSNSVVNLENLESLNEEADKVEEKVEEVDDEELSEESRKDMTVKDCFLIFRAMSKLSTKPIDENFIDVRSTAVRSKLLSLKIIYFIMKNHINCFLNRNIRIKLNAAKEKLPFVDAVRNYLLLTLTKNSVYQLNEIYAVCLDIFYILITNLRQFFINEIAVLFSEIFFPIVEMPVSSDFQKNYFLSILSKLSNDPRLLIEFYLNFDCNENKPNIIESIITFLIKTENNTLKKYTANKPDQAAEDGKEVNKYDATALNCIVSILRSLYGWSNKGLADDMGKSGFGSRKASSAANNSNGGSSLQLQVSQSQTPSQTQLQSPMSPADSNFSFNNEEFDDPEEFETLKKRKTLLSDGIKSFNFKPKNGIQKLLVNGFIKSDQPEDVAQFLRQNSHNLNKAILGEYLGNGDQYNIKVMHAFVDTFQEEFSRLKLVDAMRMFLQSFRLPGESQQIDRLMLKFAEVYYKSHPNSVFAQANTLYVLSYSIIMLNTDQHSDRVKVRMTVEDFVKNNRGIDDGKDLPRQLLVDIYNDISSNEIILESEQHQALISGTNGASSSAAEGIQNLFSNRTDPNKEHYILAAKEISNKTEKVIINGGAGNTGTKTKYFTANHVQHVRSIFDNLWMQFLAALTSSFRECNVKHVWKLSLEGIKLSVKISCMFNLHDAQTSFVHALIQFTNLNNIEELSIKNIEAINVLLNICSNDGDYLSESWFDILICISQLDRLQLIAKGIEAENIPDVLSARVVSDSNAPRVSHESSRSFNSKLFGKKHVSQVSQHLQQKLSPDMAALIDSSKLTVKIDKIFASTESLSISSIELFVKALSEVSLDEIESSANNLESPRIFSLQKMVDICYYNMNRIRVEWARLWGIIGEFFNRIGCNKNFNVIIFALDSLRQLSMRFFEIEELDNFKFQKDFLKPFEFVLQNNELRDCKLMVLECLNNMILAKSKRIRSGWLTILSCLCVSGKLNDPEVLEQSYKLLESLNKNCFEMIYHQDAFEEMVEAFTCMACNKTNQRISLHAIADMRSLIKKVDRISKQDAEQSADNGLENGSKAVESKDSSKLNNMKFYPILKGFNKVILENPDLESRSNSLDHLFDTLVEYGSTFDEAFWKDICNGLLFPIFSVLSEHWGTQLNNHDDLSVWLSTTLIQALKNMVALFTHFDSLLPMLDGYLNLLSNCILQENDTISRIGRNCLQSLILKNVNKFKPENWKNLQDTLSKLFESTTAVELFLADPLREDDPVEANDSSDTVIVHKKPVDTGIIVVKCVLQLLMIEMVSDLFDDEYFYKKIPIANLLELIDVLEKSYKFSSEFNNDYNLRVRLWNSGVIEKLPNLLKQESCSSGVYISIIFKLLINGDKIDEKQREELLAKLIPLCTKIIETFVALDETAKQRNVNIWRPVVVEILQGYYELTEADFVKYCPIIYDLVLNILDKQLPQDLRLVIKRFLTRIGEVYVRI